MANEQRVTRLYGLTWARPTPDVARVSRLYGVVWARVQPDISRVSRLYGVVWARVVRTWDDIPGAIKIGGPEALTDPDEKLYFRGKWTIGTGEIPSHTLQVVADFRARISLNGEDNLFTYQAGDTHAQIESYTIPKNKFVVGENILAIEVEPEEGRLTAMLEVKLTPN